MAGDRNDELDGMPDRSAHIIYRVTGVLKEGFSLPMPEVGDIQKFNMNTAVTAITEKKDKAGETEYTITYTVT